MAIGFTLGKSVLCVVIFFITSAVSTNFLQLLPQLRESPSNQLNTNEFVRSLLRHQKDLEWADRLTQQYRGYPDLVNPLNLIVTDNRSKRNKAPLQEQFRRRQFLSRLYRNSGAHVPRRKKRENRPARKIQVRDIDNGLTGVLKLNGYKSQKVGKRESEDELFRKIMEVQQDKLLSGAHVPRRKKRENRPARKIQVTDIDNGLTGVLILNGYKSQKVGKRESEDELFRKIMEVQQDKLLSNSTQQSTANLELDIDKIFPPIKLNEIKQTQVAGKDGGTTAATTTTKTTVKPKVKKDVSKRKPNKKSASITYNQEIYPKIINTGKIGYLPVTTTTPAMPMPASVYAPGVTTLEEVTGSMDNHPEEMTAEDYEEITTPACENPSTAPVLIILTTKEPGQGMQRTKQLQKKEVILFPPKSGERPIFTPDAPRDMIHNPNFQQNPDGSIYDEVTVRPEPVPYIMPTERQYPTYRTHVKGMTEEPPKIFRMDYPKSPMMREKIFGNSMKTVEDDSFKSRVEASKVLNGDDDFNDRTCIGENKYPGYYDDYDVNPKIDIGENPIYKIDTTGPFRYDLEREKRRHKQEINKDTEQNFLYDEPKLIRKREYQLLKIGKRKSKSKHNKRSIFRSRRLNSYDETDELENKDVRSIDTDNETQMLTTETPILKLKKFFGFGNENNYNDDVNEEYPSPEDHEYVLPEAEYDSEDVQHSIFQMTKKPKYGKNGNHGKYYLGKSKLARLLDNQMGRHKLKIQLNRQRKNLDDIADRECSDIPNVVEEDIDDDDYLADDYLDDSCDANTKSFQKTTTPPTTKMTKTLLTATKENIDKSFAKLISLDRPKQNTPSQNPTTTCDRIPEKHRDDIPDEEQHYCQDHKKTTRDFADIPIPTTTTLRSTYVGKKSVHTQTREDKNLVLEAKDNCVDTQGEVPTTTTTTTTTSKPSTTICPPTEKTKEKEEPKSGNLDTMLKGISVTVTAPKTTTTTISITITTPTPTTTTTTTPNSPSTTPTTATSPSSTTTTTTCSSTGENSTDKNGAITINNSHAKIQCPCNTPSSLVKRNDEENSFKKNLIKFYINKYQNELNKIKKRNEQQEKQETFHIKNNLFKKELEKSFRQNKTVSMGQSDWTRNRVRRSSDYFFRRRRQSKGVNPNAKYLIAMRKAFKYHNRTAAEEEVKSKTKMYEKKEASFRTTEKMVVKHKEHVPDIRDANDDNQKHLPQEFIHRPNPEDAEKAQIIRGELAAKIVGNIIAEANKCAIVSKAIGSGLTHEHKPPNPIPKLESFHNNEVRQSVKKLESMLHGMMKSLNLIIEEEIKDKTCIHLDPETAGFLRKITGEHPTGCRLETEHQVVNCKESNLGTARPPEDQQYEKQDTFLFPPPPPPSPPPPPPTPRTTTRTTRRTRPTTTTTCPTMKTEPTTTQCEGLSSGDFMGVVTSLPEVNFRKKDTSMSREEMLNDLGDTKQLMFKIPLQKREIKRLLQQYSTLPSADQRRFSNVYFYLHQQNLLLDRILRHLQGTKFKLSKRQIPPLHHPFQRAYSSSKNPYWNMFMKIPPKRVRKIKRAKDPVTGHQVWTDNFAYKADNAPKKDSFIKLVKRALYFRNKREAAKRLNTLRPNKLDKWLKEGNSQTDSRNLVFHFLNNNNNK